ncbi:Lrp/AsnC family transcriptional regulator [Puniceicoccus vermicola]|uniref:Lrp/AsnC family transcriptional regulator n=1 Tax=Puniceicoccus vermicola TaxID=388746 RepID=A0A7X1E4X8_9BACT|nr:Lrp/AsnC family transcriptional regulator [Puniceicoccus vermicola]MBC2603020.1 Lrp/AsnC family transcriptional regulator [Puniceicoccus vermicola]
MSKVLEFLLRGERLSTSEMAEVLRIAPEEVEAEIRRLQEEGTLLGWLPVLNPDKIDDHRVSAVIELKISPEREGGFDRVAMRVSKFDEVQTCYLMSGAYDLLVIARGKNLQQVAGFVSEKLATLGGVLSTATHFLLRPYKEQGHLLLDEAGSPEKPAVSP